MNKMDILININGKIVDKELIDTWEMKRLKYEYNFLRKKGFIFSKQYSQFLEKKKIDKARKELGQLKASYNPDTFRKLLKKRYILGNFISRVAAILSNGKRKYSITEFIIPRSNLTPEEVILKIESIMLKNTKEHLYMNLATNPDHFVLINTFQNTQEILEITGGSPLPTRFFAHYGDEKGLTSVLEDGYHVQIPASARLEDGTIIGGIRHQVKKEGDGFRFRSLVEFPSILPNFMVKQHQFHLACEFRQWIGYVEYT